jgi:hypothetical protein
MADPRKPDATVVKIEVTADGGRLFKVRNQDGTTATLVTSASTTNSVMSAAASIPRTLKSLADK